MSEETISIPASSVPNSKDNLYRLCEYDEESQKGCRRTNIIFALEAEYDTFVDPEMVWGEWDLYCRHEGKTYYYKNWLTTCFEEDANNVAANSENALQAETDAYLRTMLLPGKQHILGVSSMEQLRTLAQNPPKGFPSLVIETPQFFQFDDLGELISIDDLDKPLLDKIKNTFDQSTNPLLGNLYNRLYLKNDQIICADILLFDSDQNTKLGIIMVPTVSEKYDIKKAYFFAFEPLTPEQTELMTKLTAMEAEFKRPVEIVNL